ncbi:MAG: hypothetical protein O9353_13585, partial [Bacteroidia bacterium]|nr:hypothetical protein [Bacteroidia bacterium]
MCATYRDKQKRSHFESFANKIYTGIREIKPEYAEKRAIWELFQNALDTLDKNGIIEIARTEKGLLFKHNGRAFKDDEFGGLIKQFSVGKKYGDNKEKLGQYGTGFISTHVYGKIISVHGSIQTDDGTYRTLKDFEIDRDATSIEILTDKLLVQDNIIEQLCDNNQLSEQAPLPFTSFEYHANESSKVHIDEMLKYIESILPYIFCFNEKLAEVKLFNNNSTQIYTSSGQTNGVLTILKNGMPITIPFLHNSEKGVKVIMGAENRQLKDLPKQFLFYPLMETVETGYNFIVHANDFKPNKERDFLHKDIGNDDLKSDVETNHKLLESSIDLVLKLVEEDETVSFIDVAKIEFTALDSDFEKKLKVKYIDKIKDLEKLEFGCGKHSIAKMQYFDESILLLGDAVKRSIYNVLTQFRSMPPFEMFCELSKYVNNWNANRDQKLSTLELKDIGEIIAKESGGNYFYIADKPSFKDFISEISTDITLLNRFAL